MSEFRLTIHGEPVAKGRPKFSVIGGRPIARTPAKTRRYEDVIRQTAIQQWNGAPVLKDVALTVRLLFFRSVPASWQCGKVYGVEPQSIQTPRAAREQRRSFALRNQSPP
ncbi:MAG: RusA family crossover junction endodeoxyribonuclease [Gemmatimonadaceae bacterium]